jgi:hypothetical protein
MLADPRGGAAVRGGRRAAGRAQGVRSRRGGRLRAVKVEKRVYPPIPKYFNTTGPCEAHQHYMVPPLPRVPEAPGIVAMGGYFVLHAPR